MPEAMAAEQLLHDTDVASRIEAAAALSTFKTLSAITSLLDLMREPAVYYRVRVAAVAALGTLVHPATECAGRRRRHRRRLACERPKRVSLRVSLSISLSPCLSLHVCAVPSRACVTTPVPHLCPQLCPRTCAHACPRVRPFAPCRATAGMRRCTS